MEEANSDPRLSSVRLTKTGSTVNHNGRRYSSLRPPELRFRPAHDGKRLGALDRKVKCTLNDSSCLSGTAHHFAPWLFLVKESESRRSLGWNTAQIPGCVLYKPDL